MSFKRKISESSNEPRRSQRVRKEKKFDLDFISFRVEGSRTQVVKEIPIVLNLEDDPETFSKEMGSRDVAFWKEAINDEMDSWIANNT